MPQFVHVGRRWINLDKVTEFELIPNPDGDDIIQVRLGRFDDIEISKPEEVRQLKDWLSQQMPLPYNMPAVIRQPVTIKVPPATTD